MDLLLSENSSKINSVGSIDYLNSYQINKVNWGAPPEVKAKVSIANDHKIIYLRFSVFEKNVLGRYQNINDPVYKDSCVEFFISFDNKNYYNFEFNCIGNILASYGPERNNRKPLDRDQIQLITTIPSLGRDKIKILGLDTNWQLDIIIPLEAFQYSKFTTLSNLSARGNFYKCGDDLPEPHFLSWQAISSNTPDFHKPQFFGNILFS